MFTHNRGSPAMLGGDFGARNFRAVMPASDAFTRPTGMAAPQQPIPYESPGVFRPQAQPAPTFQPADYPGTPQRIPYMGQPQIGNALAMGGQPRTVGSSYGGFSQMAPGNALSTSYRGFGR